VQGTPVYRRRGGLLPIAYLNRVLGLKSADEAEAVSIVVLQAEDRQFGLVVDGINDTQEIVVKPLGKQLKGLTAYAGATIMGDGRVALILDVLGIGQRSGVIAELREQTRSGCFCSGPGRSGGWRCRFLSWPGSRSSRGRPSRVRAGARWCNTGTASSPWWPSGTYWNPANRMPDKRPIRCRWWFSTMATAVSAWW
jgi:hypothetical protein